MYTKKYLYSLLYIMLPALLISSCKKLVEIGDPVDTITTKAVFSSNKEAEWAISGLYSKMINGTNPGNSHLAAETDFAAGLSTILGGLSSDELFTTANEQNYLFINTNNITIFSSGPTALIWNTAFKAIFDANSIIEGIAGSDSEYLTDSTRKQLTGEALTIRAFSYFYLVNYFGDLPMPLTTDFNKTVRLSRSPVTKVYEQIIADLKKAVPLLQTGFAAGKSERVRINRWFAEALLARACLYAGDYQGAVSSATNVINQTDLFKLEEPANAFLNGSKEAIFQLKQTHQNSSQGKATSEGYKMNPATVGTSPQFALRAELVNSFETGDKRKTAWIAQSNGFSFVQKYKVGLSNSMPSDAQTEYYVVMRLAELYLIRAEANMLLSASNTVTAINDLNELRRRADVTELPLTLSSGNVTAAIADERKFELFAEWGHRWFDLKRTGTATDVLSVITAKMPWKGDHQLLYPIPEAEIRSNSNLKQNDGYINL